VFGPPPGLGFTSSGGTSVSTTSSTTVVPFAPSVVNVDVQNATTVADNSAASAVSSVAAAVSGALIAGNQSTGAIIQDVTDNILNDLLGTNGAITQGVNNAFASIGDVIQGVETGLINTLGGIGSTIANDLVSNLNPITGVLEALVIAITKQIGGLSGSIGQAVASVIPLIVAAVSNPIGALSGVLGSIERDISSHLAELAQSSGSVATSLGSIDFTLSNLLRNYETWDESFVENTTGYGKGETLHKDLSTLAESLAGVFAAAVGNVEVKLSDQIVPPCDDFALKEQLNNVWKAPDGITGLPKLIATAFASVIIWIITGLSGPKKALEKADLFWNEFCPLETLPPAALVDAVLRGFLTYDDAALEAKRGDLAESRFHTLIDLATHQLSASELTEALYRGLITQEDFYANLAHQGWTGAQQVLQQGLGLALLSAENGIELLRRGTIDSPTLDKILKALRYDDAQRKAIASLAFRPPNFQETYDGNAERVALGRLNASISGDLDTIPPEILAGGRAQGLSDETMRQQWWQHWDSGSIATWVDLYFRGLATTDEVDAVFERNFIPSSIRDRILAAHRPLLQFRTVETMIRTGIMSDEDGRIQLAKHGYAPDTIDWMIKYAHRPGAATKAKNAAAQHSVALGIAKEEYIDGSISGDQFLAILTQHGYTVDGANTEVQVIDAHQAMLRRKEAAQLVIDEYGAGLIDEQTALAQLAVQGLTVQELAHAAHRIRAFRVKSAKHPSEADLNHFLQLSIITPDQYKAELKLQGYNQMWADSFLAWRQHPSSTVAAPAAP
jgi:hypothetical protein